MWCGLCRAISPTFEKLSNEDGSPIGFYKVDVDAATDISEELGIRAVGIPPARLSNPFL